MTFNILQIVENLTFWVERLIQFVLLSHTKCVIIGIMKSITLL